MLQKETKYRKTDNTNEKSIRTRMDKYINYTSTETRCCDIFQKNKYKLLFLKQNSEHFLVKYELPPRDNGIKTCFLTVTL